MANSAFRRPRTTSCMDLKVPVKASPSGQLKTTQAIARPTSSNVEQWPKILLKIPVPVQRDAKSGSGSPSLQQWPPSSSFCETPGEPVTHVGLVTSSRPLLCCPSKGWARSCSPSWSPFHSFLILFLGLSLALLSCPSPRSLGLFLSPRSTNGLVPAPGSSAPVGGVSEPRAW